MRSRSGFGGRTFRGYIKQRAFKRKSPPPIFLTSTKYNRIYVLGYELSVAFYFLWEEAFKKKFFLYFFLFICLKKSLFILSL